MRWPISPSTGLLFLWMDIPLAMTILSSLSRYNLLNPDVKGFAGLSPLPFVGPRRCANTKHRPKFDELSNDVRNDWNPSERP